MRARQAVRAAPEKPANNLIAYTAAMFAVAAALGLAWAALVVGVRDYVGKNGFPGVIIGLSGGMSEMDQFFTASGLSIITTVRISSLIARPLTASNRQVVMFLSIPEEFLMEMKSLFPKKLPMKPWMPLPALVAEHAWRPARMHRPCFL